jgi:hypothetical protein
VRERDPGVDRRMILKCIFRKWGGEIWTGLLWVRKGQVAGCCEFGNEPSGSIQGGGFFEYLENQ